MNNEFKRNDFDKSTEGIKIVEIDNIYDYFLKEYEKCDFQKDDTKIVYKCGSLVYTEEMFEKKQKDYINKCRKLGLISKSR